VGILKLPPVGGTLSFSKRGKEGGEGRENKKASSYNIHYMKYSAVLTKSRGENRRYIEHSKEMLYVKLL